jgi:hypothetical protein
VGERESLRDKENNKSTYPFPASLGCGQPVEQIEVDFLSSDRWNMPERRAEEKGSNTLNDFDSMIIYIDRVY